MRVKQGALTVFLFVYSGWVGQRGALLRMHSTLMVGDTNWKDYSTIRWEQSAKRLL